MKYWLLSLFVSVLALQVVANQLDGDTQSLVIERLERALEDMESTASSRWQVMNRLADLYAERARISEMNQIAKQVGEDSPVKPCENCKDASADRRRAIQLYVDIIEKDKADNIDRVLLQLTHLYQLNGEGQRAESLFNEIIRHPKKYSSALVAQSHAGLGEIAYQKNSFKIARKHFETALKSPTIQKPGQLVYRLAWCNLNLQRLKIATTQIERILKDHSLITYKSGDKTVVDHAFLEEVSRDYATFLARGKVSETEIQRVLQLSPEAVKTDNLYHLANELDRLGKKKASLMAWKLANSRQVDPNEKLEGHVKMAQVHYDLGNKSLVAAEASNAARLWKDEGCKKQLNCDELQHKMRKLITDWDRATKKSPSKELFSTYQSYLVNFGADTEMVYWSANLAKRLGLNFEAQKLYRQSSTQAKSDLKSAKGEEEQKKFKNIFEGSLLSEIEVAELAKDLKIRKEAYQNYLSQNPNGDKANEVRYQLTHVDYEAGKYDDAADGFRALALDSKLPRDLRIKAADLSLDSLNILKDENRIERWAMDFSKAIPERSIEYLDISRKATLNKVATTVSSSDVSKSELRSSLVRMNSIPVAGMKPQQRVDYLKDKIAVARRLEDHAEVKRSAQELLKITPKNSPDHNFANLQLIWVAENTLDFKTAYYVAKRTNIPGKTGAQKELQLGIYSDLAGLNPSAHYKKYLSSAKPSSTTREVMVSLIRRSKNFSATLKEYERSLAVDSTLFAPLALEDFARTRNLKVAHRRFAKMRSRPEYNIIQRHELLKNFSKNTKVLMLHKLSRNQTQLRSSITKRLQLFGSTERKLNSYLRTGDWTLQLISLDLLAKQYARFYRELLILPIPRGLKGRQRLEYRELLKQQASPYQAKSDEYWKKLNELWGQEKMRDALSKDYVQSSGPVRKLLAEELKSLIGIAPNRVRASLQRTLRTQSQKIDHRQAQIQRLQGGNRL